jgi:hypothetical protein
MALVMAPIQNLFSVVCGFKMELAARVILARARAKPPAVNPKVNTVTSGAFWAIVKAVDSGRSQ